MFKFLHTADLHLDSPLVNLDRYDGAPIESFRSATRRALDNLVELAIREQVAFILIAGDLFDGDCRDFNTPLHLRRKLEELRAAGIRVLIIQGNHDAESGMRKAFRLQLPDNVHLFATDKPETVKFNDLRVAIHGQGFADRAVEQDLSADYPKPVRNWLNIGLLHTSCGTYEGHDRYAPSSIKSLSQKGYDYWALGHIHKPMTLAGPEPWIVYPGNPQGRHIREEGPRGCVIATVEDERIDIKTHVVDVLRWAHCQVDTAGCDEPGAVLAVAQIEVGQQLELSDGRPLAVRLELVGRCGAHRELSRHSQYWDRRLREAMIDRFDEHVWVEKIKFHTQAEVDPTALDRDDPLGELLAGVRDPDSSQFALTAVRDEFDQLLKQLPSDPRLNDGSLNLEDPAVVETLLAEVRELLTSRLLESGGAA